MFWFQFKKKKNQKHFLWASQLWVGKREEPILGYVPKNNEKKNSGAKEAPASEQTTEIFMHGFLSWSSQN